MKPGSLLVVAACFLPVLVVAQEAADVGAGGAEQMPAQQARDDLQLLRTLAQLDLTTGQIAKVIPHLEQIQAHLETIADRRAKTYAQERTALESTRTALIQGDTPRSSTYDNIRQALGQLQLAIQVQMQKVRQEEAGLEAKLTGQQLDRIETSEQRDARIERVRELEGEMTAAAYIVKKLGEIRELLPDEYARVRLRVANEVAVKTEGARSPRFNAYRQRVLAMMDEAYRWTVVEFRAKLPTLERAVAVGLEIRPEADAPSAEGLIPYEEYAATLRNPRTIELLREMLERRGGGAGD